MLGVSDRGSRSTCVSVYRRLKEKNYRSRKYISPVLDGGTNSGHIMLVAGSGPPKVHLLHKRELQSRKSWSLVCNRRVSTCGRRSEWVVVCLCAREEASFPCVFTHGGVRPRGVALWFSPMVASDPHPLASNRWCSSRLGPNIWVDGETVKSTVIPGSRWRPLSQLPGITSPFGVRLCTPNEFCWAFIRIPIKV